MTAKFLQCLMLLTLSLSCYGYLRMFMRSFRLPPEFALVCFLSAVALIMFVAGCFNILLLAAYMILVAGLVMAGLSAIRREKIKALFTPGMLLWLMLCAFSFFLVIGQVFYYVDDFSHWATVVKVLLKNDSFPTLKDKLVYFPKYPLGSSSLIYWFARVGGINSEWFQMLVQAVYISACLSLPAVFLSKKKRELTIGFVGCVVIAFAVLGANIELTSLYVDTLLPLVGLSGVWLHMYSRNSRECKPTVPLLILCCYAATVKESGIFFAVVIAILILVDSGDLKRGSRTALLLIAGIAAVKLLWSVHYKSTFGIDSSSGIELSIKGLFPGVADKQPGDVQTIIYGMLQVVCRPENLIPLLGLIAITLFTSYSCKEKNPYIKLIALGIVFYVLYCAGQTAMYILFMVRGEAIRLAAFDRYFASIQIFIVGYFLAIQLAALNNDLGTLLRRGGIMACYLLLAVITLSPNPDYFLRTEMRVPGFLSESSDSENFAWAKEQGGTVFWAALRSEYDRVRTQYRIPEGLTYTVFIAEDYSIETRLLTNYLLSSCGTYVVTDKELQENGKLSLSYEYYIVLEETETNMHFVQNNYGSTARAGYAYQVPISSQSMEQG